MHERCEGAISYYDAKALKCAMAFQAYECAQCAGARKARYRTTTRKHENVRWRSKVRVRTMRRSAQGAISYYDAKARTRAMAFQGMSAHNAQERARREIVLRRESTKRAMAFQGTNAHNAQERARRNIALRRESTKTCDGVPSVRVRTMRSIAQGAISYNDAKARKRAMAFQGTSAHNAPERARRDIVRTTTRKHENVRWRSKISYECAQCAGSRKARYRTTTRKHENVRWRSKVRVRTMRRSAQGAISYYDAKARKRAMAFQAYECAQCAGSRKARYRTTTRKHENVRWRSKRTSAHNAQERARRDIVLRRESTKTCDGVPSVRVRTMRRIAQGAISYNDAKARKRAMAFQGTSAHNAQDRARRDIVLRRESTKTCDGVPSVRVRTMRRSAQGAISYNDAKARKRAMAFQGTSAHNAQERARRDIVLRRESTKTCDGVPSARVRTMRRIAQGAISHDDAKARKRAMAFQGTSAHNAPERARRDIALRRESTKTCDGVPSVRVRTMRRIAQGAISYNDAKARKRAMAFQGTSAHNAQEHARRDIVLRKHENVRWRSKRTSAHNAQERARRDTVLRRESTNTCDGVPRYECAQCAGARKARYRTTTRKHENVRWRSKRTSAHNAQERARRDIVPRRESTKTCDGVPRYECAQCAGARKARYRTTTRKHENVRWRSKVRVRTMRRIAQGAISHYDAKARKRAMALQGTSAHNAQERARRDIVERRESTKTCDGVPSVRVRTMRRIAQGAISYDDAKARKRAMAFQGTSAHNAQETRKARYRTRTRKHENLRWRSKVRVRTMRRSAQGAISYYDAKARKRAMAFQGTSAHNAQDRARRDIAQRRESTKTCDGVPRYECAQCAGARKARYRTTTRKHENVRWRSKVRVRTMRRSAQGAISYYDAKARKRAMAFQGTSAHNAQDRARRDIARRRESTKTCDGAPRYECAQCAGARNDARSYNDAKAHNVRWRSRRTSAHNAQERARREIVQ